MVSKLLGEKQAAFTTDIRTEYASIRQKHAGRRSRTRLVPIADARRNRLKLDWTSYTPPQPNRLGVKSWESFPISELRNYIDWTPFFRTWELAGKFPRILEDPVVGESATQLFQDAQRMLDCIIEENWLTAKAAVGLFPANSVGDDVELYVDESRSEPLTAVHFLRQQMEKPPGRPNLCLADFIAPKESGVRDYLGMFVVTSGHGLAERVRQLESAHDDYNAILLKALADRLAEAFAEFMHACVRRELWGYAPDEQMDNDALIKEAYRGIRPAPGYPACPDHTEKGELFRVLDATCLTSVSLTDSFAMTPAAAVSGYYFSHPDSQYFGVGRVNQDQVEAYAGRKETTLEVTERWLASNLAYDS